MAVAAPILRTQHLTTYNGSLNRLSTCYSPTHRAFSVTQCAACGLKVAFQELRPCLHFASFGDMARIHLRQTASSKSATFLVRRSRWMSCRQFGARNAKLRHATMPLGNRSIERREKAYFASLSFTFRTNRRCSKSRFPQHLDERCGF